MPGTVRPVTDERDSLLAFLAQTREGLRLSVSGLTEEEARSRASVSTLNLAGLIKHQALVERNWTVRVLAQRPAPDLDAQTWTSHFVIGENETMADWLRRYKEIAAETEAIVRALPSMDEPVPVPHDQPWFPKDVDFWSARWVLQHVILETARHAGHADIIRESIDGKQALQLMAEEEGWAAQLEKWMKGEF